MDNFTLIFNNAQKFKELVGGYSRIHVFIDESVNKMLLDQIKALINFADIVVSDLSGCDGSIKQAESLCYHQEDYVLCAGKSKLCSTIKYYCYQFDLPHAIIPVAEFTAFALSKYAYLFDQINEFYVCSPPNVCYILPDAFSSQNLLVLERILSYAGINNFEKEFANLVLGQNYILDNSPPPSNMNLQDIFKKYASLGINLSNYGTAELGQDYLLLCCQKTGDICKNLENNQNTLIKFYECMLKFDLICREPDINLYMLKLKKHLNLQLDTIFDAASRKLNSEQIKDIKYKFSAYLPYLSGKLMLAKEQFVQTKNFNASWQALALCGGLVSKMGIIKFAKEFGYFEELLKDI